MLDSYGLTFDPSDLPGHSFICFFNVISSGAFLFVFYPTYGCLIAHWLRPSVVSVLCNRLFIRSSIYSFCLCLGPRHTTALSLNQTETCTRASCCCDNNGFRLRRHDRAHYPRTSWQVEGRHCRCASFIVIIGILWRSLVSISLSKANPLDIIMSC